MPIIATAGHVDHGKSTLVRALTGRDPDRWDEEKRRGLTIDLGFAWTRIGDHNVGFVDVPGHERFIKNMLAGVGAVDVALFVVAADEGWMPQSEEHLAVLDALELKHGVVALTRIDLVDPDLAELAAAEVAEQTAGTSLESWPVVPVSAVSGTGLTDLSIALAAALDAAGEPRDIDRPRLWVDRAFLIGGAGLIVTGTLADGALGKGDEVGLWPGGHTARIRTIQSHETEVDQLGPGNRAALNLVGTERTDAPRGTMLGRLATFGTTRRLLAWLRPVRAWPGAVGDRGAYHLHVGTGHWAVRIRLPATRHLEDAGPAILQLPEPLPLRMGDRFVIREVGRRIVVAGGVVLDPSPATTGAERSASYLLEALRGDRATMAQALLAARGAATLPELANATGGGTATAPVQAGDLLLTAKEAAHSLTELRAAAADYHRANPMRPGIPKATLASATRLEPAVVEALVGTTDGGLIDDGSTIRSADFEARWSDADETAWQAARSALLEAELAVPRATALGLSDEVLHTLLREGRLVQVAEGLVYLPEQIDRVLGALAALGDAFTVAEFRDELAITRRQAVPLLEWLDAGGWTSRRGDVRNVRRWPTPPAGAAPTP